jgi:2,4-diketo-3-deoxy-L-fuconate hydrolase
MWLDLNGERVQTGSTKTMIFGVAKLVSYVSQFMTLMPGRCDHHRHATWAWAWA